MRYLGATTKQRKYAMGVLDEHKSRREVALAAGYSNTMADNPKMIEQSVGFRLAMAEQATQAGFLASGVMNEINARGFKDYSNKDLLHALDIISKAFERFVPKEKEKDSKLTSVFANVINVPTSTDTQQSQVDNTIDHKDSEESSDYNVDSQRNDSDLTITDSVVQNDSDNVADHDLTDTSNDGVA